MTDRRLSVLARYDEEPRVLLYIPPAHGAVSLLVEYIASKPVSTVLISTPAVPLAEQWAARISRETERNVIDLRGAGVALEVGERGPLRRGDVVIATHAFMARGIARRSLGGLNFDLLIVDDPGYGLGEGLPAWIEGLAARVLVKIPYFPARGAYQAWPVVRFDTAPPKARAITRVRVESWGAAERSAIEFTLHNPVKQWTTPPASRPSLQQRLLSIASEATNPVADRSESSELKEISEKAWAFIDEIDGLDLDPRLLAVDKLVRELSGSPGIVILTESVIDARYVAAHLSRTLGREVPALNSAMSRKELDGAVASSGFVVACTAATATSLRLLDSGADIVFWGVSEDPGSVIDVLAADASEFRMWLLE